MTITSAATGQIITYSGGQWINAATSSLGLFGSSTIGTYVQGYDAGLASLAALGTTGLIIQSPADTFTASSVLSVSYGGTGVVALAANGVLYGNGTGNIQATAAGANGTILYSNNGTPAWIATSSFLYDSDFAANGVMTRWGSGAYVSSSTISVAYGGTGSTTLSQYGLIYGNGTAQVGTIGAGTAGYMIMSNGNGAAPVWTSTSTFVHDSDFTTTGIVLRTGTNAYTASGTLSVSSAAPA